MKQLDTEPIVHRVGRRSKMEILCDVMDVVSRGVDRPTRIMQVANLTWNDLLTYLETLVRNGFLMKSEGARATYLLTAKGRSTLSLYQSLKEGLAHAELEALSVDTMSKALKQPVATKTSGSVTKDLESRLTGSGFSIESNQVVGKSGVKHVFDVVAKSKDGTTYGYAILNDVDDVQVLALFVKQLDTGLNVRVIYKGTVSPTATTLANTYSIRLEEWPNREQKKTTEAKGLDLIGYSGRKVLFQVDPNVGYETVIRTAISEYLAAGRSVFCFTWKGSPIYEAVSAMSGLVLYIMSSEVSYTKQVPGKNEFLVPKADQPVLLEEMSKAVESNSKKGAMIVFDSVSDMVMLTGIQQTYEFLRHMSEIATGSNVTTFAILRLQSQDAKVDSLIKGIYTTHLVYDSTGLKATR